MNIETLFAHLHELGRQAESQTNQIQTQRYLPDELVTELKQSGAIRLWVAEAYGGSQAHVKTLVEAVQTLSYYNGSLGWVLAVTGTAGLGSGYMIPSAAKTIFSNPLAMTGGWAAPAGQATIVEGGIQVKGKWSWGSGIRYCSHIVGGVMMEMKETGRRVSALAYFDPEDVELIDNWDVLGLHGTNSIDYEVRHLFVPDGKWMYFPVRKAQIDATLYRFSFMGALASGVAAVGLGLAQRAIEEIIQLSKTKVPNGAQRTLAERPVIHEKIALMQASYRSAKLLLEDAIDQNWAEAEAGNITSPTKAKLRLAATHAVREATEIVSQAYRIGGGSSIWNGVKLQELLRDVHVVSQHGMISPAQYEIAGRVAVGAKVNEWLL